MNNPFQEQFLKAGIASKQQVNKVNQQKQKRSKQNRANKKTIKPDENALIAQQKAKEKADKDRELNQKKQLQAKNKAISIEIDKLVTDNKLKREQDKCETPYHFQHRNKINKIYINDEMKTKIVSGKLGIARIEGRYEIIPESTAKKIQQRNEKRVILLDPTEKDESISEEYAEFEIPDDLMW